MAYINFQPGFNIQSQSAIDKRILLSEAEMKSVHYDETLKMIIGQYDDESDMFTVPEKYFAFSKTDHRLYLFDINNEVDTVTGKYALPDENSIRFSQDLSTMYSIGKYEGTLAQAVTIPAEGKTIKEVWNDIFQKEDFPRTTAPSLAINSTNLGKKEVGELVAIEYATTYNPGFYTYGPATGCVASDYKIKFNNEVKDTESGIFTAINVADNTNLFITGTFDYTAGAIPVTNIGNQYAAGQIPAGNDKNANPKGALTGYRKMFYGTFNSKETLTTELIRGLNNEPVAVKEDNSLVVNIPVGTERIVIAVPNDSTTIEGKSWSYFVSSAQDKNDSYCECISSFNVQNMLIPGANNFAPINYKVYVSDFANQTVIANKYYITIEN